MQCACSVGFGEELGKAKARGNDFHGVPLSRLLSRRLAKSSIEQGLVSPYRRGALGAVNSSGVAEGAQLLGPSQPPSALAKAYDRVSIEGFTEIFSVMTMNDQPSTT